MATTAASRLHVIGLNARGVRLNAGSKRQSVRVACQLNNQASSRAVFPGTPQGSRNPDSFLRRSHEVAAVATADEEAAWRRRLEESKQAAEEEGRSAGDSDAWRWTLNWDYVTPDIAVGSCPRSAADIDTIADKAKVTAIVNLQSDICFDALQIPFPEIKQRSIERGVFLARVPVRDFDHGDQAAMLPEAVRVVNVLINRGHKVYLHCTAGINRAPLVALAYLYFIQGCRRDEALKMVKAARAICNPYLDCLTEAKRRLLEGRDEELTALATDIYEARMNGTGRGDASSDWSGAQARALARSFTKYLEVDLGVLDTERALLDRKWALEGAAKPALPDGLQGQLNNVRALVVEQKAKISQLRALVEQWEREEAVAESRAAELQQVLAKSKERKGKAAANEKKAVPVKGSTNGKAPGLKSVS